MFNIPSTCALKLYSLTWTLALLSRKPPNMTDLTHLKIVPFQVSNHYGSHQTLTWKFTRKKNQTQRRKRSEWETCPPLSSLLSSRRRQFSPPPSPVGMRRLWRWYQQCLATHPVRTQVVSSGILWGLGDIGAQAVTHYSAPGRPRHHQHHAKNPPEVANLLSVQPLGDLRIGFSCGAWMRPRWDVVIAVPLPWLGAWRWRIT
jgi:hypothetical protein